jgi:hypothetical protein
MPTCTSCHYHETGDVCTHPQVNALDPVRGQKRSHDCHHMRANDGPCGPEGRLWVSAGSAAAPPPPERPASIPDSPPDRPEPEYA